MAKTKSTSRQNPLVRKPTETQKAVAAVERAVRATRQALLCAHAALEEAEGDRYDGNDAVELAASATRVVGHCVEKLRKAEDALDLVHMGRHADAMAEVRT